MNLVPFLPNWNFVWPLLIFVGLLSIFKIAEILEACRINVLQEIIATAAEHAKLPWTQISGTKEDEGGKGNNQTIPVNTCKNLAQRSAIFLCS